MITDTFVYSAQETQCEGFLAKPEQADKLPAVLVVHDWRGRNEFTNHRAEQLAQMGYLGFAVDMYGEGRIGNTIEERMALMNPLVQDRQLLRDRITAAWQAVAKMPEVDTSRIAVIGYCFGGMCALDLARSGADIKGAVSFHGLLNAPTGLSQPAIKAKVLVLHGYDDPMVKPEQVQAFCQEMTQANVDWQVDMYGHTKHAFTNPEAHDETLGLIYQASAAHRSWQAMQNFLQEIL